MARQIGLSVAATVLVAAGLMAVGDVRAQAGGGEGTSAGVTVTDGPPGFVSKVLAVDQGRPKEAGLWTMTPATPVWNVEPGNETLTGPAGQYLTLERKRGITGPCEWSVAYRMRPAAGATASIGVQMSSVASEGKPAQILHFSSSLVADRSYLSYAASVQGPKPAAGSPPAAFTGYLYMSPVTERSLAWSEEMRRAIEEQIAGVAKTQDMVFTLRWVVEDERYRCWVNGRYVGEMPIEAGIDRSGPVRIQLSAGVELVSVRARPYAQKTGRFEPISIAGHVNSKAQAQRAGEGQGVLQGAWPERSVTGGVPFEYPGGQPTNRGNDHIDVGQSWTRFGAIAGYIAGNFGTFGGRWISADRIDPARVCLYVPQGRYKALHLMAVSEDRPNSVPVVTAQFYRPDAGHPINFAGNVPGGKGESENSVPVTLANGKKGRLHHVVIPLDPDAFSWFSDLPRIGLEITKQVQYYRGYPDPLEYSWHGAGLPSSVQIYAMTLERVGVDAEVSPDKFGHVWTDPESPSYTLELRNKTGKAGVTTVEVTTRSEDGKDKTRQIVRVPLPADGAAIKVPVKLTPKRYGLHEVAFKLESGSETTTLKRNMAFFHPDTREKTVWHDKHGPIFGFWPWNGGHTTPTAMKELEVMGAAGAETSTSNYASPGTPKEVTELAEKLRFVGESAFGGGVMYFNGFYSWYTEAPKFDPANPKASGDALIKVMKKYKCEPGPISRPTYVPFFAEPHMGNITVGVWPSHYGEDYKLSTEEQRVFEDMKAKYMVSAAAIRKEWPDLKLLLPYGDPMNAAIFLKLAPESRALIDGCALDMPAFERLPEQQINQVVLNRLYPILKDIKEYVPDPYLMLIEGTCTSSKDIDTLERGQSDTCIRNFLVLLGYGVYRLESSNSAFDCANYWGENHYGGGWCSRLPLAMPKPAYVQYATLTRNINRANFVRYVPTGSTSTYCQEHKHYKTGALVHVLWTIRGTRPVSVKVPAGAVLRLYDPNDNVTELKEKNGVVTFDVDQSPRYLHGVTGDMQITLGESDHSDSVPKDGPGVKLTNFGDGSWRLEEKGDEEYQKNKPLQIERFLAKMTATPVEAPRKQGGKALAVHLEKQAKDRGVMPYFTTLSPSKAIDIPGKASHLAVWVRASSDWGRVVYSLRDAKGEKWISVGTKDDWNNDDIHGWSHFCFDGWRLMDFQLPSNAPYDSFREYGTSWWAHYGGDGVVDLPLKLEKVIVERRNKAIYGNDLVPVKADDVLLGDVYAQYASKGDQGREAVELSKVRMPVPAEAADLSNPIAEMRRTGTGEPTRVLNVRDPEYQYDGTRCHVLFEPVAGAATYDVWVSPYADGKGAIHLGKGWKAPGELIQGLRPEREFYVFVTHTDAKGVVSKPSAGYAFKLKDRFGYK